MPTEKKNVSDLSQLIHFNSVQLNLVTIVDVHKANESGTLDGCVYMMDNGINSQGQGSPSLQTICKQGQTLNWIIYAMDSIQHADGTWPPTVRIANIVFLDKNGSNVSDFKVCRPCYILGAPDSMRAAQTPVYYYWAGTVLSDLPPGIYGYRMILELDKSIGAGRTYMNTVHNPALTVLKI